MWGDDLGRIVVAVGLLSAGPIGPADAQPRGAVLNPVAPAIDVPYLPQTGVLCGGAALAMVLRHWGDRRVTIDEFAPLVDHAADGIADDVLVAEAGRRGWQTVRPPGTIAALAESLARGHPPILLIEDRSDYYHYVVAVGLDEEGVLLHDPAWGPARHLLLPDFLRQWEASGNWMLLVLPDPSRPTRPAPARVPPAAKAPASPCEAAVEAAIQRIDPGGPALTEARMEDLRRQCPGDSRPVSELAALHFSTREWAEAERLATAATRMNPADEYAWDVLASSRFLQDDTRGALAAWNRIGRPRIDLVRIEGLTHTRYALVAEAAGLKPGALLTPDSLERGPHAACGSSRPCGASAWTTGPTTTSTSGWMPRWSSEGRGRWSLRAGQDWACGRRSTARLASTSPAPAVRESCGPAGGDGGHIGRGCGWPSRPRAPGHGQASGVWSSRTRLRRIAWRAPHGGSRVCADRSPSNNGSRRPPGIS